VANRGGDSEEGNNLLDTCRQVGHDLPACHPGRLWSLWDIMNHCNVGNISLRIGQIALYESTFANSSSPNGLVALENYTNFIDQLRLVFDDLRDGGLNSAAEFVATTYNNIHMTEKFTSSRMPRQCSRFRSNWQHGSN
jgi:hypothetical protein